MYVLTQQRNHSSCFLYSQEVLPSQSPAFQSQPQKTENSTQASMNCVETSHALKLDLASNLSFLYKYKFIIE